jgi:predicted transglutaminase-like cysteine proteinase
MPRSVAGLLKVPMIFMWRASLQKAVIGRFIPLMLAALMASVAVALEFTLQLLIAIETQYGDKARARVEDWQQLLNTTRDLDEAEKLRQVNSFFNRITFLSDQEHWGQEDYWATPLEMLATNGGDCEDYSIAKYFTLKTLGVDQDKLRITYVKALRLNQAHMVLAYYATPDADPLILDNLTNDILPASRRTDLYPVYSFNGDGLWLSKQRGLGRRVGDADKLSNWKTMNERFLNQLR